MSEPNEPNKLAEYRKAAGLTQAALADAAGISAPGVAGIERWASSSKTGRRSSLYVLDPPPVLTGEDLAGVPVARSRPKKAPALAPAPAAPVSEPCSDDAGDKLLEGLMAALPAPGSEWSQDGRDRWLLTANSIFGLVYGEGSNAHG